MIYVFIFSYVLVTVIHFSCHNAIATLYTPTPLQLSYVYVPLLEMCTCPPLRDYYSMAKLETNSESYVWYNNYALGLSWCSLIGTLRDRSTDVVCPTTTTPVAGKEGRTVLAMN